jgi:short subunit dehydrogenase-like uncharacterized protein
MALRAIACLCFAGAAAASAQRTAAAGEKDLDLIVYGATGCVGGFAAQWLAKQKDLRWAVAGRNAAEIKALGSNLCAAPDTLSCPEQIVAPLDAQHDLTEWVRRTRVVVTFAGPFSVHSGNLLVEACSKLGVHYVDTSDEFYWQRRMIDSYDATAKASGAHVVLSGGFCALAGDLGAQLALTKAGTSAKPGDEAHVDAWLETYNGGVSAGVLNTGKAIKNATFPKEWGTDPYVLAPHASPELKVDTSITGVGKVGWDRHEGAVTQNLFGPYDARLLRRTFTTLGQAVHFRAGSPPSMYTKWTAFLAAHPGSWSNLTKCPTKAVYDGGAWRMRVRAEAKGSAKGGDEVVLSGSGDPGYHFTAAGAAEVGLCLAGHTKGCLRASAAGGVTPPLAVLEPLAIQQRLEAVGLLNIAAERSGASLII